MRRWMRAGTVLRDFNVNTPVEKATDVPCRYCGAQIGASCKGTKGTRQDGHHIARWNLYHRIASYQIQVGIKIIPPF